MNTMWVDAAMNELDLLAMEKDNLLTGLKDEDNELVKIAMRIRIDLVNGAAIKLEQWIQDAVLGRDINELLASNEVKI